MTDDLQGQTERFTARIGAGLDRACRRMAAEIAAAVMTEAKLNAPVDTGRLRDSLTPATEQEAGDSIADEIETAGGFEWEVGSNVTYAIPVEYGTKRRAATPFLRPALESVKEKAPAYCRGIIQEELRK